jgi:hypothetical protein
MRLPTGTYSINAAAWGDSVGDTMYAAPADQTNEEDFDDPAIGGVILGTYCAPSCRRRCPMA